MITKVKQHVSDILQDTSTFFNSRYQKNKQATNAITAVLVLLFVLLCLLILPFNTETVTVTVDPESKKTIQTTTTDHGMLDVFGLYLKIVGGASVLGAAYFGWKRLEVNQEGQITERFTRAIDQLGNEKLEVRLGGIYALERIAKDSVRDYLPIMEILTTYVREHSPYPPPECLVNGMENTNEFKIQKDTRAILRVIKRRPYSYEDGEGSYIRLSDTMLVAARLYGADLQRANFNRSDLSLANLSQINLESAQLFETKLEKARLSGANLKKVNLYFANLSGANLRNANLTRASLNKATLTRAKMDKALLIGAKLSSAIDLTKKQIESAIIDRETKLPDYLMDEPEWYAAQINRSEEWLSKQTQGDTP